MLNKKKKFINIVLLLLVCILPVLCILMFHHLSLSETIVKMEKGCFGDCTYILSNKDTSLESKKKIYQALCEDQISCALYLDDKSETDKTIRYMAFTQNYVNMPMLSGCFFEKSDFEEEKKVAIVGKKVNGIYDKNGTEYIQIKNQEYRVLGTLGYEEDTAFDTYVFINLFSCEDEQLTIYTIDFFGDTKENELEQCIQQVASARDKLGILSATDNFAEAISIDSNSMGSFVGLLGSYILCIVLVSFQWLLCQRRELGIRRLLGASKNQNSFYILRRYMMYLLVSFLVGFGYCNYFYSSYKASFYKGYVFSAGILLVFMLVTIERIKRDSIEEVIKQ